MDHGLKVFSGAGSIENNWTLIPNWIFGLFGENCLILKYNCNFDNIASLFDKNIPLFYKELLKLTLNFNHANSVSKSDVIFHNLSLCYKGNCLFFPDWLKYGIMYVGQVVDENNTFISYNQVKQLVKDKGCLMFQYNVLKQALSSVSISSKTQERKFGDSKLIRSVLLKKNY